MSEQPQEKQRKKPSGDATAQSANDAGAGASVAVLEKPAEADSLAGIYQFTISPYVASDSNNNDREHIPTMAIPAIHKTDDNGKLRKFNIVINRGVVAPMMRCSECVKEFEVEPLLRPSGAARRFTDEAKWLERHQESLFCPSCKAKGIRARGTTFNVGGFTARGRLIPNTYYLTHEEVLRLRQILTDGREINIVEQRMLPDGRYHVVATDEKKRVPYTRRFVKDGIQRTVSLGGQVSCNEVPYAENWSPVNVSSNFSATAHNLKQMQHLLIEISKIDESIEKGLSAEKPWSKAQLDAALAKKRELHERIMNLGKQGA